MNIHPKNDPLWIVLALLNIIGWAFLLILDIIYKKGVWFWAGHLFLLMAWVILFDLKVKPVRRLIAYVRQQIEFAKLARQRRDRYEKFKKDFKDGLIPADEFENEARGVIK